MALAFATLLNAFSGYAASAGQVPTYPTKPVRLIVGPAAGGPTDGVARRLGAKLNELWGQPVVVDNRPGAGNTIATTLVAKSTPDGYTLLLCPLSDTIAPAVYEGLRYDFLKDIVAISRIGTTANVLVAHPSLPARTLRDFIEYAKSHPGELNYGAQGIAQAGHLSMELLKWMAGRIEVVYIPYKGAPVLTADLLAGRVQVQITNLPSHLGNIRNGKLRALAVTIPQRDRRIPDVPAIAEVLPGYDVTTWYGVCGPAGISNKVVEAINLKVSKAVTSVDLKSDLEKYGVDAKSSTPEEFENLLRAETAKWQAVVRNIGIAAQSLRD